MLKPGLECRVDSRRCTVGVDEHGPAPRTGYESDGADRVVRNATARRARHDPTVHDREHVDGDTVRAHLDTILTEQALDRVPELAQRDCGPGSRWAPDATETQRIRGGNGNKARTVSVHSQVAAASLLLKPHRQLLPGEH